MAQTKRFQISERPKHGQWWVWDHEDDRMPKIVGRYWDRDEAKQVAAAKNERTVEPGCARFTDDEPTTA